MIQRTSRMQAVQDPIIPIVGQWVRETPGTISLGQGVVSYDPPPQVQATLAKFNQKQGIHRYQEVQGIPPLRQQIFDKVRQENGLVVNGIHQVVVTAGSNMGFMNAILAITQPGDEIIVQTPYYFNHEMAIRMADCVPVLVNTTEDYQLQLEAIAAAITAKTRAVVTISPNNPTGAVYPAPDLQAVNRLCGDHNLYHISDEAYEYFTYGATEHCSPGTFNPSQSHTISLFSLSKAYGFASWRIGYMVIPEHLQTAVQKIQDTILICPPVVSQHAAISALSAGKVYTQPYVRVLATVRENVLEALNSSGVNCYIPNPEGAFYVFLRCDSQRTSLNLVESLVREYKIATIPGVAFGIEHDCSLRIAYGALKPQTVNEGISRLILGLSNLL